MKSINFLVILVVSSIVLVAVSCTIDNSIASSEINENTWAEKLGYPAGKKVLILHADDIGMCDEANIAASTSLINGDIQSAAIMMPCPNAEDFVKWAIENPKMDIGLHLTLTSEWQTYRWGPLTDSSAVPGLIDPESKLWREVAEVAQHASAQEVEAEIRSQIDKSIALGYRPNHIDTHMGTLYARPDYVTAFLKVAMEYNIPANVIDLSNPEVVEKFKKEGYPINDDFIKIIAGYTLPKLDNFKSAPKAKTYEGKIAKFKELVDSLDPGLIEIIFHPSVETDNLKTITNSWQQRVWEAQMFRDPDLIDYFKNEEIVFTNWIEIMERFDKLKK